MLRNEGPKKSSGVHMEAGRQKQEHEVKPLSQPVRVHLVGCHRAAENMEPGSFGAPCRGLAGQFVSELLGSCVGLGGHAAL